MTDSTPDRRLPTGTVTFLRTDVEGSLLRMRAIGPRWDAVNATHIATIQRAVADHGGVVVRTEGDAVFAAFDEARAAAAAAVEAQRALQAGDPAGPERILVRMGLHTGEAHRAGDDYGGFEVNRAARIAATAHGGQIVVSEATRALIDDALPAGTRLDDLGAHLLRDVARPERLSQLTILGLRERYPPPRTGGPVAGDLPERVTSFVGREAECAAIERLLAEARVVTLTGPGGIGKSSLAVEAARRVAGRYPDGAWFVPLADVADPAGLAGAIARGVGLLDGPERTASDALLPFLAERSLLLILDNLEHLVGAADEVASIVRASPGSRLIVTSRARLHIAAEHEVAVQPLRQDAVRLFVERAQASRPDWEPGAEEPIVEEICRLLDDLPLGIELAAARIAVLPPAIIRDRLASRLPLPGQGPRDLPARQRTLEATVAWSRELLDPSRRALLDALAVFDGGFDHDQVMVVAGPGEAGGDRLDDLLELADQSLIVPMPDVPGRARFRLLRTIETSGLDRLAEAGRERELRRRHAEAFLALVHEAEGHLGTSQHAAWIERISPEQANLRAAMRWAIDHGQGLLAIRLTAALWRFWHAFGQVADGRAFAERALAMPEAPQDGVDRAWAEAAAGNLAYWQSDIPGAHARYQAQIRIATDADDARAIADAYFNYGHVAFIDGLDVTAQVAFTEEVIARYRALGDERGVARAAWAFAIIAMSQGDVPGALEQLWKSRDEFARLDDRQYHAMTEASLGWAAFMTGDMREAIRRSTAALVESQAMGDLGTTTISLHIGVLVVAMTGRFEEAAEVHGAFDALCDRYGVRPPASLERFIGDMDPFRTARDQLDPEAYDAAYQRGRRMSLDEAVALVVALGDAAAAAQ